MNRIHEINVDTEPHSNEYAQAAEAAARLFPEKGDMLRWAKENTVTEEFNGKPFRYLKYIPENPSGRAVVAGGEFANGNEQVTNIARLRILGQAVDPNATLYFLPGSNLQSNTFGFTGKERGQLLKGDMIPVVDRYRQALENEDDLVLFGPSQGGFTLGAYAAHPDTPASALTVLETPDTQNRSLAALAKEYGNAGPSMMSNVRHGFAPVPASAMANDAIRSVESAGLVQYGLGLPRLDNLALASMMTRSRLGPNVGQALEKGGSVVQSWGMKANLSGDDANTAIANQYLHEPGFEAHRLTGERSDHSLTNLTHISNALVQRSIALRKAKQEAEKK